MDPDANLSTQRYEAERVLTLCEEGDPHDLALAAKELAEHVQALDEWLVRGGFLPKAWQKLALVGEQPPSGVRR